MPPSYGEGGGVMIFRFEATVPVLEEDKSLPWGIRATDRVLRVTGHEMGGPYLVFEDIDGKRFILNGWDLHRILLTMDFPRR